MPILDQKHMVDTLHIDDSLYHNHKLRVATSVERAILLFRLADKRHHGESAD